MTPITEIASDGARGVGIPQQICYGMTMKTELIEVDTVTARALKKRADERGISMAELLAELATMEGGPIEVDSVEIAELDRRWKSVEGDRATVPHADVVRWLRTWGTPAFRQWRQR